MDESVVSPTTGPSAGGSFESAFASRGDSSSSPASTESTAAVHGDAPATAAPAEGQTPLGEPVSTPGPIPFEVHKRTLENARSKARDEALAQWRHEHGWAESVSRDQAEAALALAQRIQQDPAGAVAQMWEELQAHPNFASAMRSQAARILSARQQAVEADTEPSPDIQSTDERGQPILLYSAGQQAKREAWVERRLLEQVGQRLEPLQAFQAQQQQEERQRAWNEWATNAATQQRAYAKTNWPEYERLEPAIYQLMAQYPTATLDQAYIHVYKTQVLPTIQQQAQTSVLATLQQRATASSENPAAVTASASRRPASFEELFERRNRGEAI